MKKKKTVKRAPRARHDIGFTEIRNPANVLMARIPGRLSKVQQDAICKAFGGFWVKGMEAGKAYRSQELRVLLHT